jgi:pilus assembly protein CpaB
MNRRLVPILFVATLIGLTCAYAVYHLAAPKTTGPSTVRVVAAKDNIKIGTLLAASNLSTIDIAGPLPKGAILKPEGAIGRGVISNLIQGEPVLEDRLAAPGSGGGLAATIPAGMRACAVKVDEVVGVAGFVTPGLRVDVLTSGTPPGVSSAAEGIIVNTILQNIEVLSAGTDIQKDDEGKPKQVKVVNLLVTPEQAETLSLASNHLTIQLVLRNPLDTKIAQVPRATLATLLAGQVGVPVPAARPAVRTVRKANPKPFSIELVTGSKRSELQVATSGEQK